MNYSQYYIKCRENYPQQDKPSLEEFYYNPVVQIPVHTFDDVYMNSVKEISDLVKQDFDSMPQDPLMTKCKDLWKYKKLLSDISNCLVPYLEENRFGCNLGSIS